MVSAASTAPDAIEPVIAWRAWALARTPSGEPELRPIIYAAETWPAREAARAACPPHRSEGHRSPGDRCTCGLYAVDGLDRLPRVTGRDVTVVGSVAMWGRLLEHDAGFRAEFAYPQRLRLVCGRCWETGAFAPNVERVAPTSRGTLIALCSDHARGAPGEPSTELQEELLSAYAADRLSEETVGQIASAWSHPARGPRRSAPGRAIADAAMAFLFFGLFLGIVAFAVWLR